jgi:hypothetical protein
MFKNQYQYGKFTSLLSVAEKEQIQNWAVSGSSLKKAYDKSVKSYVFVSDAKMKLSMPATRG